MDVTATVKPSTGKKRSRDTLNGHGKDTQPSFSLAKYCKINDDKRIVIDLGSLVRHKDAPKGTVGIVLAYDEETNFATIYHPAPDEITIECMEQLVIDVGVDSTFRHGYIGQFQTTLVYNDTAAEHGHTHGRGFYMAECSVLSKDNIDNLVAKNVQFIRNTCLSNGLVPIVRQITDISAELHQVTIAFDILVTGTQRRAPLTLMSKLLRTENTLHIDDVMRNQLRFAQLRDRREWDIDSLMKLSESSSCKGETKSPLPSSQDLVDIKTETHGLWPNQLGIIDKMTEAESRPCGIARCFWFPIPTDSNIGRDSYHYSPFFDSVINSQHLSDVRGGILADETSLGKTRAVVRYLKSRLDKLMKSNGETVEQTLVIVASVKMQHHWANELENVGLVCRDVLGKIINVNIQKPMRVAKDTKVPSSYVTITTPVTFSSLQNIACYYRVILDDVHVTMFGRDGVSSWWSRIQSTCRWIITHSPVQNTIMDMEPLLDLFSIPGFDIDYWRNVKQELGQSGCGPFTRPASEFVALFVTFSNLMQRTADPRWNLIHTTSTSGTALRLEHSQDVRDSKTERRYMTITRDDNFTTTAPPFTTTINAPPPPFISTVTTCSTLPLPSTASVQIATILIPFRSRVQRELYMTETSNLKQRLACNSCNTASKTWSTFDAHIQRIRRLCSFQNAARTRLQEECACKVHGEWWKQEALLEREMQDEIKSSQTLARASIFALQSQDDTCPICYQLPTRSRQTPCCNRVYCLPCIKAWLAKQENGTCPLCREKLCLTRLTMPLFETKQDRVGNEKNLDTGHQDNVDNTATAATTTGPSSKLISCTISATMNSKIPELVRRIRTREKTVIMSHFHSSLLQVSQYIRGSIIVQPDGYQPTLDAFQHGSLNVLLVLFKADSSFILPSNVDRVYLMEPSLDAMTERRIIGRLLDKTRPSRLKTIEYLVMKDTIEQSLWQWNFQQLQESLDNRRRRFNLSNDETLLEYICNSL